MQHDGPRFRGQVGAACRLPSFAARGYGTARSCAYLEPHPGGARAQREPPRMQAEAPGSASLEARGVIIGPASSGRSRSLAAPDELNKISLIVLAVRSSSASPPPGSSRARSRASPRGRPAAHSRAVGWVERNETHRRSPHRMMGFAWPYPSCACYYACGSPRRPIWAVAPCSHCAMSVVDSAIVARLFAIVSFRSQWI
jgi:hypothetical protein